MFTICLFFLATPECVYVNRGNHESEMFGLSIQPGMGHKFMSEIQEKFPKVELPKFKMVV